MRPRIKREANLVSPAGGYFLRGHGAAGWCSAAPCGDSEAQLVIEMSRSAPHEPGKPDHQRLIRRTQVRYQNLMGFETAQSRSKLPWKRSCTRGTLGARAVHRHIDNDGSRTGLELFATTACTRSSQGERRQSPAGSVIHCDNAGMLRDRVVALRNAHIYAPNFTAISCRNGGGKKGVAASPQTVVVNVARRGIRRLNRPIS